MEATQTRETRMGHNRTGMKASPLDGMALERKSFDIPPPAPGSLRATEMRKEYTREADTLGSVPPPVSIKGVGEAALQALQGHRLASLIDKLGERLAFERSGVRLYEALLVKCEALGTWQGGPTRELLEEQCNDELQHFHLMKQTLEHLGADPTAMTPSADVAGVEASGLLKVITDPCTTLSQALHSLLIIEDADSDGWDMLVEIATSTGQKELADQCRAALATEETHKQRVREWLGSAALADARGESEQQRVSMH